MRNALAIAVASAVLLTGCTSSSPVAPTSDPQGARLAATEEGTLTVRVLARNSEQPISGAAVQSANGSAVTDTRGECVLTMAIGEEIEVSVSAAGYEPMIAAAALTANERWTFYLQHSDGSGN